MAGRPIALHLLKHAWIRQRQTSIILNVTRRCCKMSAKAQTPLIRFVVDLLYTACCTTNPQQIE